MKKSKYRKYKEIYQVDLNIIKEIIKDCDINIKKYNDEIEKSNKKIKNGGKIKQRIDDNDILYMLIPNKIKDDYIE